MTETARISKLTVILEDDDMKVTTVFHKIYNPMLHVNYRDVTTTLNADGAMPRPPSKADFMVEGVALFDHEHNNFVTTTREEKKDGS